MSEDEFDKAFNEAINEVALCLSEELQEVLNRSRVWVKGWVGKRDTLGASETLFRELAAEDPLEYKKHMRMSIDKFNELLSMVEPHISKLDTPMRNAIPARVKLEVTLRFLASGDSYQSLALLFQIPPSTISSFLPEVLQAIISVLGDYIKVSKTKEEWSNIKKSFSVKWNFPMCCGALDGKHILIKRPPDSCSEFYNYKGGYSVILLALVDADCKFLFIDVGTIGRANDSTVFRVSTLKVAMEKKNLLNWPEESLIISDDAFPLRTDILKPFTRRNLTLTERIFNYRLSRARRVVENAFGILATRFRIFNKPIEVYLAKVDLIIQCACSLHNWLRVTSPSTYFEKGCIDYENQDTGIVEPGSWRSAGINLPSLRNANLSKNYSKRASLKREALASFYEGHGSVPWQLKAVGAE